jgi:hypothetical protein
MNIEEFYLLFPDIYSIPFLVCHEWNVFYISFTCHEENEILFMVLSLYVMNGMYFIFPLHVMKRMKSYLWAIKVRRVKVVV